MLGNKLPNIITDHVPGPMVKAQINRKYDLLPKAYHSELYPIVIARGEGAMIEDLDGNVFLDWIGGVGVLNIGYSRQEVIEAVKEQADHFFHAIFSVVSHKGFLDLAESFNQIMPCAGIQKKTYFANTGAEANENAIKVAKSYTKRNGIVCFTGAFHGRTNLMMELTANKAYAKGMGPFPSGIHRVEYPNLYRSPQGYNREDAITYYIEQFKQVFQTGMPAEEIAAIIIEPLQGEGGFVPAPIEWVKAVRKICDEYGILIIADEVQSGNCRTGKYFASEYWKEVGAAPDIITTAKSMGSGLPISAITARTEIMDAVVPGTIGGTYNGNPLSCAAALKTNEILIAEDFAGKANRIGEIVSNRYEDMKKRYPVIGDVRGLGAMLGMEFVKDRTTKEPYPEFTTLLIKRAIQKGLLIENAGIYGNVIRFLAPLVITDEQLSCGLDIYESCIVDVMREFDINTE